MACARCGTGSCGGTCGIERYSRATPGSGARPQSPDQRTALSVATPLCSTLARDLIGVADGIRDLFTQFGLRPYVVNIVRTRWSGGKRGVGVENVEGQPIMILPTPMVSDLSAVAEIVTPIGLDEFGEILVSEVSGAYTEDQLRGAPIDGDENFYYEIEFPPPCSGADGERRRFTIKGAPMYFADQFHWQLRLERQRADRTRSGVPR